MRHYRTPYPYDRETTSYARLTITEDGLAFETSFSRDLVDALKQQIPVEGRRWNAERKVWLLAPGYAKVAADLARQHLGVQVAIPVVADNAESVTRLLRLEYLGRAKDRGNGQRSAFGWVDGSWSVIIPESVLRTWFGAPATPTEQLSLYAVLTVVPTATAQEIKSAHRRLALQWHPDRCREPDAAEQFKAIQQAYRILADVMTRKKYDVGRMLEASLPQRYRDHALGKLDYAPPIRCGFVLAEGRLSLGRFVVETIFQWEDVIDAQGRTLVTSWPMGAEHFTEAWV